jgi:hypothetical protein
VKLQAFFTLALYESQWSASCSICLLMGNVFQLGHYATSRKVAGTSPDEVDFFQFTQSFQPHYAPGVDSASNRNEYQNLPGG